MPIDPKKLPLSLYIHLPWCVSKCPYCDFNSHGLKGALPERDYVTALTRDLQSKLRFVKDRSLVSIFFGGGTPSLFSAESIATILHMVRNNIALVDNIEITLEANPATIEAEKFADFKHAGVNRLSIGVQSFQDDKLKVLGRAHNSHGAQAAIERALAAGFTNFNIDLMFGLPGQTLEDALYDLQTACAFSPAHLSWYQLTLEPNTLFYVKPPVLPIDDAIWEMQEAGMCFLREQGYQRYEVSAYAKDHAHCQHNLNYWQFGDYIGIGAGAHSKVTDSNNCVRRLAAIKHPRDYMMGVRAVQEQIIDEKNLIFEFMLNVLRLEAGFDLTLFTERTGLTSFKLAAKLALAKCKNLLEINDCHIRPTPLGQRFLNDLMAIFLD